MNVEPDAGKQSTNEPSAAADDVAELLVAGPIGADGLLGADLIRQLGGGALEQLRSLSAPANAGARPAAAAGDDHAEVLNEIADDVLAVRRQIRDLETGQQSLGAKIDASQETWSQSAHTIAKEIDGLRRELLGERRHLALADLFGEVLPLVDRLKIMRAELNAKRDARMIAQVDGVVESLTSCLRRLGCRELNVAVGAPFDPSRMECVSYVNQGEPGVVLGVVQNGYVCGQVVLRPATVKVAAQPGRTAGPAGDKSHER